jgi:hypothetical protein
MKHRRAHDTILSVGINDTDGFFSGVNERARDYAAEHAGEQWPDISDTTREEIRDIIKNAFSYKMSFDEVVARIQNAGMFSTARAEMIATTETNNAMVRGQFDAWKRAGFVTKVKWLCARNPCPLCKANADQVRNLGDAFPSGDVAPLAHPCCECILQAVEFKA